MTRQDAQYKVARAVKKGILVRGSCARCGLQNSIVNGKNTVHGHHEDYRKPLDVVWLCQKCHMRRHRELFTTRINISWLEGGKCKCAWCFRKFCREVRKDLAA